jgi:hypothetical protein
MPRVLPPASAKDVHEELWHAKLPPAFDRRAESADIAARVLREGVRLGAVKIVD